MRQKDSDRRVNCGFVNYAQPIYAQLAKEELDGKELDVFLNDIIIGNEN